MALTFSITDVPSVFDTSIISIFTFTVKILKGIKIGVCKNMHTPLKYLSVKQLIRVSTIKRFYSNLPVSHCLLQSSSLSLKSEIVSPL